MTHLYIMDKIFLQSFQLEIHHQEAAKSDLKPGLFPKTIIF